MLGGSAALAVAALGCDVGKRGDAPATGPAATLIGTSFEKFRDAKGDFVGVRRKPRIVLRFSRPMSPGSVSRANFSIDSGGVRNVTALTIRVDPVERAIVLMTADALAPSTEYTLSIHPSDVAANRLSAYDGAPYEGTGAIRFTTAGPSDKGDDEGPFDPVVAPCAAYKILYESCTGANCHGGNSADGPNGGKTPPAQGLSLIGEAVGGIDTIQATAIGHASVGVALAAEPGGVGNPAPHTFPYGMPIVEPGSSAGSYLVYKVLRRVPDSITSGAGSFLDPTVPDVDNARQVVADDLERRAFGAPMPHPTRSPDVDGGVPYGALSWEDLVTLRAWIDQGAGTCACPTGVCADAGADGGGDGASDAGGSDAADAADASSGDAADATDGGG